MNIKADDPDTYIGQVPDDRKEAISQLRKVILENLPEGFSEEMNYGMIGYVVPHSLYPDGYHSDPARPLPFMSIASQKNHIALYHFGMYAKPELLDWFTAGYREVTGKNPDMGKSCIRFRKPDDIPFGFIAQLVKRMEVRDWIETYEKNLKKK